MKTIGIHTFGDEPFRAPEEPVSKPDANQVEQPTQRDLAIGYPLVSQIGSQEIADTFGGETESEDEDRRNTPKQRVADRLGLIDIKALSNAAAKGNDDPYAREANAMAERVFTEMVSDPAYLGWGQIMANERGLFGEPIGSMTGVDKLSRLYEWSKGEGTLKSDEQNEWDAMKAAGDIERMDALVNAKMSSVWKEGDDVRRMAYLQDKWMSELPDDQRRVYDRQKAEQEASAKGNYGVGALLEEQKKTQALGITQEEKTRHEEIVGKFHEKARAQVAQERRDEYEQLLAKKNTIQTLERLAMNRSDQARAFVAATATTGEFNRAAFDALPEEDKLPTLSMIKIRRGEMTEGYNFFDLKDENGNTVDWRRVVYGVAKGITDIPFDVARTVGDITEMGAIEISTLARSLADREAALKYRKGAYDELGLKHDINNAMTQDVPEADSWYGRTASGFGDNFGFLLIGEVGAAGKLAKARGLVYARRAADIRKAELALDAAKATGNADLIEGATKALAKANEGKGAGVFLRRFEKLGRNLGEAEWKGEALVGDLGKQSKEVQAAAQAFIDQQKAAKGLPDAKKAYKQALKELEDLRAGKGSGSIEEALAKVRSTGAEYGRSLRAAKPAMEIEIASANGQFLEDLKAAHAQVAKYEKYLTQSGKAVELTGSVAENAMWYLPFYTRRLDRAAANGEPMEQAAHSALVTMLWSGFTEKAAFTKAAKLGIGDVAMTRQSIGTITHLLGRAIIGKCSMRAKGIAMKDAAKVFLEREAMNLYHGADTAFNVTAQSVADEWGQMLSEIWNEAKFNIDNGKRMIVDPETGESVEVPYTKEDFVKAFTPDMRWINTCVQVVKDGAYPAAGFFFLSGVNARFGHWRRSVGEARYMKGRFGEEYLKNNKVLLKNGMAALYDETVAANNAAVDFHLQEQVTATQEAGGTPDAKTATQYARQSASDTMGIVAAMAQDETGAIDAQAIMERTGLDAQTAEVMSAMARDYRALMIRDDARLMFNELMEQANVRNAEFALRQFIRFSPMVEGFTDNGDGMVSVDLSLGNDEKTGKKRIINIGMSTNRGVTNQLIADSVTDPALAAHYKYIEGLKAERSRNDFNAGRADSIYVPNRWEDLSTEEKMDFARKVIEGNNKRVGSFFFTGSDGRRHFVPIDDLITMTDKTNTRAVSHEVSHTIFRAAEEMGFISEDTKAAIADAIGIDRVGEDATAGTGEMINGREKQKWEIAVDEAIAEGFADYTNGKSMPSLPQLKTGYAAIDKAGNWLVNTLFGDAQVRAESNRRVDDIYETMFRGDLESIEEIAAPLMTGKPSLRTQKTQALAAVEKARQALAEAPEGQAKDQAREALKSAQAVLHKANAEYDRQRRERFAKKQSNADQSRNSLVTPEEDAAYSDAVKRGDTVAVQSMLKTVADRAGYTGDVGYRISHHAPINDGYNASLDNVKNMFGTDDRTELLAMCYGRSSARQSVDSIMKAKGNPDAMIDVYRAVPKSVKDVNLRRGDWVALSEDYARQHGEAWLDGKYKIIHEQVRAGDLYTDGNMIEEAGFDDGNERVYADTKNGTKLMMPTYDDAGNLIPLSQRFNRRNADIRYSLSLGLPYQGTKGQIARDIVDVLPQGDRFVDLFAGGGAMTHGAMLSGKYGKFLMNDKNPSIVSTFVSAMNGEYDGYDRQVTKEEFDKIKGTPEAIIHSKMGYGRGYEEDASRKARNLRRIQRIGKEVGNRVGDLTTMTGDYQGYAHRAGDVVYADIPYANTDTTGYNGFDHARFAEWVAAQDYPVYVSSYEAPSGMTEIASWETQGINGKKTERLFVQDKFADQEKARIGNRGRYSLAEVEEAAKAWGALTDKNGKPIVLYHGSRSHEEIYNLQDRRPFFTTSSKYVADKFGGDYQKYALYGRMENPLEIDAHGRHWDDIVVPDSIRAEFLEGAGDVGGELSGSTNDIADAAERKGYDGVIIRNVKEGWGGEPVDDYVFVRSDGNVKSADEITYDYYGNEIPLNERFNNFKGDIRYSLILGEEGAKRYFINRDTLIDLEKAKSMLGDREWSDIGKEDQFKILSETGWQKGADGKWREEINDGIVGAPQFDLKKSRKTTLGDFLGDDFELFRAYPQLLKTKLDISYRVNGRSTGSANFKENKIKINAGVDNEENQRTLVHEIQHLIQGHEGFARGGNETTMARIQYEKVYNSLKNPIAKELMSVGIAVHARNARVFDAWARSFNNGMPSISNIEWMVANSKSLTYEYLQNPNNYGTIRDALYILSDKIRECNKYNRNSYHRLAGEVESRNAERRTFSIREMNPLLEDTEDEPRMRQIFHGVLNAQDKLESSKEDHSAIEESRISENGSRMSLVTGEERNRLEAEFRGDDGTDYLMSYLANGDPNWGTKDWRKYIDSIDWSKCGDYVRTYRAMEMLPDGGLIPPMASFIGTGAADRKINGIARVGDIVKSDENPELRIKIGKDAGKFPLWKQALKKNKNTGKYELDWSRVPAAYNPYIHSSFRPLNDQFQLAWARPNLYTVEMLIPTSEFKNNSRYWAEFAKNSIGLHPWTSGSVTTQLTKFGRPSRQVLMTQYGKINRVLSNEEVAQKIMEDFGDAADKISIPQEVFPPAVYRLLTEKHGVKGTQMVDAEAKMQAVNEMIAEANGDPTDLSLSRMSLSDGEEAAIYVNDGMMRDGTPVNFIDLMLDGVKLGETRTHNRMTTGKWVGLAKDGKVYGRVMFGKPIEIGTYDNEYYDSFISGTNYDIAKDGTKWYYPIIDKQDFRENPIELKRNGNYGVYDRPRGAMNVNEFHSPESYSMDGFVAKETRTDDAGETVVQIDGDRQRFSLATWEDGGRDILQDYLAKEVKEGRMKRKDAQDIVSQMETMYTAMRNLEDKYVQFGAWSRAIVGRREDGTPVMCVIKTNGDYDMNLDFSTLCKKRRAFDRVIREIIKRGNIDKMKLDEANFVEINKMIREAGFEVACELCFVDSKRYRGAGIAAAYSKMYNRLVNTLLPEGEGVQVEKFNLGDNPDIKRVKGKALHNLTNEQVEKNFAKLDAEVDRMRKEIIDSKWEEKRQKAEGYTGEDGKFVKGNPQSKASYEKLKKLIPESKKYDAEFAKKVLSDSLYQGLYGGLSKLDVISNHLKTDPLSRRHMVREDLIDSTGFYNAYAGAQSIVDLYNNMGTAKPKETLPDVQFIGGEITGADSWTPEAAYSVGGVRVQSFSDFVPHMVFDYMQMFAELAAKGLPAHAYTKEALFAKIFGKCGLKINMSLVPFVDERLGTVNGKNIGHKYAGLTFDGSWTAEEIAAIKFDKAGDAILTKDQENRLIYLWNEGKVDTKGNKVLEATRSFPFADAMEIQDNAEYSDNCGTIAVGVSDAQIWRMLDDPRIRMIIPYHKSSVSPIVARLYGIDLYTDYTDIQTTKGAKKKEAPNFNDLLRKHKSAKKAADAYLKWCRDNGCTPKFEKFSKHKNYYKMLEDFTCDVGGKYKAQMPVRMNNEAFPKDWLAIVEQGLGEDDATAAKLDEALSGGVDDLANKIVRTLGIGKNNGNYSLAIPPEIGSTMSTEDLLAMAAAGRIAKSTGGDARKQTEAGVRTDMKNRLAQLGRPADDSAVDALMTRAKGDADAVMRGMENSASADIMNRLSQRQIEKYFASLRSAGRKGIGEGTKATKAEQKLVERQAQILADSIAAQTGISVNEVESYYGIDLADTVLAFGDLIAQAEKARGEAPEAEGETAEEEGEAPDTTDDSVEVDPVAKQAHEEKMRKFVQEWIEKAYEADAEWQKKREERKAKRKAAEKADKPADTEEEDSGDEGDLPPNAEDFAQFIIDKQVLDLKNPNQFAQFIKIMCEEKWKADHGLGKDAYIWGDPVALQHLRMTAAGVYDSLCRKLMYSGKREQALRQINSIENAGTIGALVNAMEFTGKIIAQGMVTEKRRDLVKDIEKLLEQGFGAKGRFKQNEEDIHRKVSGFTELWAREVRKWLWIGDEKRANELQKCLEELAGVEAAFRVNNRDPNSAKNYNKNLLKMEVLTQFGALYHKSLGEITDARAKIVERLENDTVGQQMMDREERTRAVAEMIEKAVDANRGVTYDDQHKGKIAKAVQSVSRYAQQHLDFKHLLLDLARYCKDDQVRQDYEAWVNNLQHDIQRRWDKAQTEKRKELLKFRKAVESIYGKSYAKVMQEMMSHDPRFDKFGKMIERYAAEGTPDVVDEMLAKKDGKSARKERVREITVNMSKAQALQLYVSMQQKGYLDNVVKNGRQGQSAEMRNLFSKEDLRMIDWLGKWYDENREAISEVSNRIFGLPVEAEEANYFPVKPNRPSQGLNEMDSQAWSPFPPALTARVRHGFDFDVRTDIFGMWAERMQEQAQWKQFAELGVELRGIFGRQGVQSMIKDQHGAKAWGDLKAFINDILNGGAKVTGKLEFWDEVRGWTALAALGGNIGVMIKQTTSIPAFAFEIGWADMGKYFTSSLWAISAGKAGSTVGIQSEALQAMREIFESDQRKNRWDAGNSDEVSNAFRMFDTKPSLLKNLMKKSMCFNKWGDIVPALMVGQGVYRAYQAQGLSKEEAMNRTWEIINRTQQTGQVDNLTAFQRRSALGRFVTQFQTTVRQYTAYEIAAIRNFAARPNGKNAQALASATALNAVLASLYYWGGAFWQFVLGKKPDEETVKGWMESMLTSCWSSLFLLGSFAGIVSECLVTGGSRTTATAPSMALAGTVITDMAKIIGMGLADLAAAVGYGDANYTLDDFLKAADHGLRAFNSPYRDASKVMKNYFGKGSRDSKPQKRKLQKRKNDRW